MNRIFFIIFLTITVCGCKVVSYNRDAKLSEKVIELGKRYQKDRRPAEYDGMEDKLKGKLPAGMPNRYRGAVYGILTELIGRDKALKAMKDYPEVPEEEPKKDTDENSKPTDK